MPKSAADDLAKMATGFIAAVAVTEVQMVHLLQAEIGLLTKGAALLAPPAEAAKTEAETEAGFDNMPV